MNRGKWIALTGCAVLGIAAVVGSMGQALAPRGPRGPVVNPADPAEQLTRLQMDVFGVDCTLEQLAQFELEAVSTGDPSTPEILRRLAQFGAARVAIRYDNCVDLTDETHVGSGKKVPAAGSTTISDGTVTQSVDYRAIDFAATLSGAWLVPENPMQAQIRLTFSLANPAFQREAVGNQLHAPVIEQRLISRHSRVLKSGAPVWFACNGLPPACDADCKADLIVIRIKAIRLMEALR